ncbi:MAG: CapA family protein [Nannocystis sp.]|nr:CapA family protein [Nannocystis sp.]
MIEANGVRVAVTAHDLTDGLPAGLAAELRAARAAGDLLVSTFHGTGPPSYLPSAGLRDAVAVALAAGAQVVAGHGSHTLARVELREGAVIAYGLGNLAFDCRCTDERDALVLEVTLGARGLRAASVVAIDAGIGGEPARLASDPGLTFDLLAALGGAQGRREGGRMWLIEGGG